jgi:hypothetical protein
LQAFCRPFLDGKLIFLRTLPNRRQADVLRNSERGRGATKLAAQASSDLGSCFPAGAQTGDDTGRNLVRGDIGDCGPVDLRCALLELTLAVLR